MTPAPILRNIILGGVLFQKVMAYSAKHAAKVKLVFYHKARKHNKAKLKRGSYFLTKI